MSIEVFAAIVFSSAVAVPPLLFLCDKVFQSRRQLTPFGAFAGSLLASLSVAWLAFASSFLFWIFPIAILASLSLGYVVAGMNALANDNELWVAVLSVAIAGAILTVGFFGSRDPAFGYYPAVLMLANYGLFVGAAVVRLKRR